MSENIETRIITLQERILSKNEELAQRVRQRLARVGFVVNLISSPGAGKTSLLEATVKLLRDRQPVPTLAVIEGDIVTDQDAERILRQGVPAIQIQTKGDCHLDARMILGALDRLEEAVSLDTLDLLIIENVGNLVCPTEFDLGEDAKVVVASVAEGDDKPSKYPATFFNARAIVVNKIDLLPYTDCNIDRLIGDAKTINPALAVFPLSCRTGEGLAGWVDWLIESAKSRRGA